MSELDIIFNHHNGYIELPEELTQRMWDLVRSVAAANAESEIGPWIAEAVAIKNEVDTIISAMIH